MHLGRGLPGRSAGRDALIFFQIENNRMFVLDVRSMVRYRRGLAGYIGTAAEVQKYLAVIRKEMVKGRVPSGRACRLPRWKTFVRGQTLTRLCAGFCTGMALGPAHLYSGKRL